MTALDDKGRFVLPQSYRLGLVEGGALEFAICMSASGCLSIYRMSEMKKIVAMFEKIQHQPRFQGFLTLFFSTLYHTTCDKLGRVQIPSSLRDLVKLDHEIVIAGVISRIELWPKAMYEAAFEKFTSPNATSELKKVAEEAFALLHETDKEVT